METQSKRRFDGNDIEENSSKRRRKEPDLTANNEIKITALEFKNPVQQLHEIKWVHPLNYEIVSEEGPADRRVFKYHLKFKFNDQNICFNGQGSSKKKAQRSAAMNALYYMTKFSTSIFTEFEIKYIQAMLNFEVNSLKLNFKNIDEYFNKIENGPIDLDNKILSDKNKSLIQVDSNNNNPIIVNKNIQSTNPNILSNKKTLELISTAKNSTIILNHLVPSDKFKFEDVNDLTNDNIFKIKLTINKTVKSLKGERLEINLEQSETDFIFYGSGPSKKHAKSKAAQSALENLFSIDLRPPENDIIVNEKQILDTNAFDTRKYQEFADNISELIKSKYNEMIKNIDNNIIQKPNDDLINSNLEELNISNQNKFRNVYAGIVETNGYDFKTAKLICLTTGTKCVSGQHMSLTGLSLNDCHAEILAIRLLRKYFYKQLNQKLNLLNESNNNTELGESNIFEFSDNGNKLFRLKKKIKYHLFISSAPCGDARIFAVNDNPKFDTINDNHPNRKVRGLLRAKIESGEGTIPFHDEIKFQTWDGIIIGERLRVMSCSDKLCKYNVIGVQGALLSNFINTVYLDTIIVGCFYHKEHMGRALFDRISQNLSELPEGFNLNRPILCSITNNLSRNLSKASSKSYLWSKDLKNEYEIVCCKEGKKIEGSASEICKYELFKEWLKILNLIKENNGDQILKNRFEFKKTNEYLYHDAKMQAKDYQTAKLKLYEAFKKSNLGYWITKPFEQNHFVINY